MVGDVWFGFVLEDGCELVVHFSFTRALLD